MHRRRLLLIPLAGALIVSTVAAAGRVMAGPAAHPSRNASSAHPGTSPSTTAGPRHRPGSRTPPAPQRPNGSGKGASLHARAGGEAATRAPGNHRAPSVTPLNVTTSQLVTVAASTLDDPLSRPAGPAATAVDLPATGCQPAPAGTPAQTPAGEGILSLTMAGPGTDWSDPANTSTAVAVSVDGGPSQVIVLFAGAQPFRYQGFLGTLPQTPGDTHCVNLTVRPDLSHTTATTPAIQLYSVSLGVVPPGSPDYLLETHDPVLYGRSTSAAGDTPLITYGQSSPDPDGSDTDLSYTVTWTHEDVGDGAVPAYEWGLWGRMTDVEDVIHEKVSRNGAVLSATYLSCGCEWAPIYPDVLPEDPSHGGETDKPYPTSGGSQGLEYHLGIRDATGNNDISPTGTTPYRFQQTLVAAPAPGQAREVAQDQNPWTYRISNDELVRETAQSSDPRNFVAGTYPQYLIVDIDSAPSGTGSVSIAVQLDDGAWYSNDYSQMTDPGPATTFPFYDGGHERTVIKLPVGWHSSTITGLRLTLNASSPTARPTMNGTPAIELIEVTPDYQVVHRPVPVPQITTGTQIVPSQLGH